MLFFVECTNIICSKCFDLDAVMDIMDIIFLNVVFASHS